MTFNKYYDLERTRREIARGEHRRLVGGYWEEIGALARDYLIDHGLLPGMTFLDIGCGCLRVGVHLVEYLEAGHYFGIDLSDELLTVGYERELGPLGLCHKLPRENLLCDDEFDFGRLVNASRFDMALALSLFTHLPMNHLRLCLERLEGKMPPGAKLILTLFHCPADRPWHLPMLHQPGGITSYPTRDVFHYRHSDLQRCAHGLPWHVGEPQQWGHPRAQAVAVLTRLD